MRRFWDKVDKSGDCWEWTACKDRDGYGGFQIGGHSKRAHRISWELSYGEIPEGMHVLHMCDNPPCVNPEHLCLGTNADNMADRDAKGRHVPLKGEMNGSAKITKQDAAAIRFLRGEGYKLAEIGELFSMSFQNVSRIVRRELWT